MSKKIDDIKYWAMVSHQGIHPSVSFSKTDFDWLIEQAERAEIYKNALLEIGSNKFMSTESGIANAALIKADLKFNN